MQEFIFNIFNKIKIYSTSCTEKESYSLVHLFTIINYSKYFHPCITSYYMNKLSSLFFKMFFVHNVNES
jgi:hypothetical protein